MANLEYRNLIQFVKEGNKEAGKQQKTDNYTGEGLTGEDAKLFYQSVVESGSCETDSKNSHRKRRTKSKVNAKEIKALQQKDTSLKYLRLDAKETVIHDNDASDQRRDKRGSAVHIGESSTDQCLQQFGNELLKCAEEGNLNEINRLTKNGVNINHSDAYGWTALMCAGVAGHMGVVEYLLNCGADRNLLNNQGKSALQLAKDIGAAQVSDLMENFSKEHRKKKVSRNKTEQVYCDICKSEYSKSSEDDKSHLSSTVHLFNLKLKPKPDPYMITETNIGYKMMRQAGWDGEKGLGPEGQGHRYPIRTTLKRDRSCLGSYDSKVKAKITHYGPHDEGAVDSYQKNPLRVMSAKTISRKEQTRREKKAKEWERNLRFEMNMD